MRVLLLFITDHCDGVTKWKLAVILFFKYGRQLMKSSSHLAEPSSHLAESKKFLREKSHIFLSIILKNTENSINFSIKNSVLQHRWRFSIQKKQIIVESSTILININ
jgi:hypothetical protein